MCEEYSQLKNSQVSCVCRPKVLDRGNQHPFMYTSHIFKNNFIFFCLHWVVIAVHEGFLVEALVCRLHQLWPVGSVVAPPGPRAEAQQLWCMGLVAPQLGGGNFPDQGPNLCLLY